MGKKGKKQQPFKKMIKGKINQGSPLSLFAWPFANAQRLSGQIHGLSFQVVDALCAKGRDQVGLRDAKLGVFVCLFPICGSKIRRLKKDFQKKRKVGLIGLFYDRVLLPCFMLVFC